MDYIDQALASGVKSGEVYDVLVKLGVGGGGQCGERCRELKLKFRLTTRPTASLRSASIYHFGELFIKMPRPKTKPAVKIQSLRQSRKRKSEAAKDDTQDEAKRVSGSRAHWCLACRLVRWRLLCLFFVVLDLVP